MVGLGKRKNSSIDGELQQNFEEIVIVKKRKQIVRNRNAKEQKGEQRTIVKKRKEDSSIVTKREKVDSKKEIAIVEKRDEIMKQGKIDDDPPRVCKSLPEELWTESILPRLPARTLANCHFVSKLWHNAIYKDTRFSANHRVQNKSKLSLIFNVLNVFRGGLDRAYFFSLEEKDNDDHHLDPKFLTRLVTRKINELVGYCNGLACLKLVSKPDDAVSSITVVNPIRAETLVLPYVIPTGGYMYLCHGFGFDSLSEVYKAVIVFTSKDNEEFLCMVITLGTSSWRKISTTMVEISPPLGSSPFPTGMVTRVSRMFCRPATFCRGDLFWRTTSEVGNDGKIEMLLSFNLHNEKIQFIHLPMRTTTVNEYQHLVVDYLLEFKGYPCIARSEKIMISNNDHHGHRCDYQSNFDCCCCCKVHMYILKDKVKQVWIREETLDVQIKDLGGLLPAPFCCYFDPSAVTPPTRVLTLSDQVLLYWFTGERLILYNLREKYLKVVKCSLSYPRIFRTKMNDTLDRLIGDDNNINCPYMDYQLHAQEENLLSMKAFIPKGVETIKYDCLEDLQHTIKSNLPAGWVVKGRKKCYAFY